MYKQTHLVKNIQSKVECDIKVSFLSQVEFVATKKSINLMNRGKMDNKTTIAKNVGHNLKVARQLKGISQKDIASELNKYQSDYSDYETGKIELDYEKIVYLCKRFDITPNDLFEFNY